MTAPETILIPAFGTRDDDLDGQNVIRLHRCEGVETFVEARHRQRLSESLPISGACERFSGGAVQSYPEALAAFIWGLKPDCTVTMAFAFNGCGNFSLSTEFVARDRDEKQATTAVTGLRHGFDAALAAAALRCRFADDAENDQTDWHSAWHAEILPPGIRLLNPQRTGASHHPHFSPRLVAAKDGQPEPPDVLVAQPRMGSFASLDAFLRSLAAARCPLRLVVSLRPRLFQADELRLLSSLRERSNTMASFVRTDGMPAVSTNDLFRPIEAWLRTFGCEGRGIEISVRLEALKELPDALLNFAAGVFWGAHQPSKEHRIECRDWRNLLPLGYQLPQWMPSRLALQAMGAPLALAQVDSSTGDGTLLGKTVDGDEVRISDSARERHIYCCGATGSGKSTTLANLILQDIKRGRGLILIDPHGDISADVMERVPREAEGRIVALDLADPGFAPGLNVFDVRNVDSKMAKSLVRGELLRILKCELYPDVPEAFGPMFELYFSNAIMLLLEANSPVMPTLVDVPRIFQDIDYRKSLIERCANSHVRDFWKKTADRVTNDEIELENIAPYVIAKFEPFLGSNAIRTIVGQAATTLEFGTLMNEGRAVIISLSKGMLGTNEARVLGLLLLQQIQIACMARARLPRADRRPCTLYVDEAQSFVGGALTELLAEARKFGLSLVLANQTMAQLSSRTSRALLDVVLGNVGNLIVLRTGVRDAEILAPWFRPHLSADELVGMQDFSAAVRILDGSRPADPVLVKLVPLPAAEGVSSAETIATSSRVAYCRPRSDVEAELEAR